MELKNVTFLVFLLSVTLASSYLGASSTSNYCTDGFCDTTPDCATGSGTGGGLDYSNQTFTKKNFSGKPAGSLKGANFTNSTFIGVTFANADLSGANFKGAKFQKDSSGVRTDLSNTKLTNACFTGADLAGANLSFAQFQHTDFSCADLSDTEFGPVVSVAFSTIDRTRFNYATLGIAVSKESYLFPLNTMSSKGRDFWTVVDFTCTHLDGVSKENFNTKGIDFSGAKFTGQVLSGYEFYDKKNPSACDLSGGDFSGTDFSNAKMQYCNLAGVDMSYAILDGTHLTEANFYQSDHASDLTNASLNGTILNNATLSHANLAGANLTNVQAIGSDTDFSAVNMQSSQNEPATTVTNSSFDYANFSNAAINNVTFANSSLNYVSFEGQTLSGTDFSHSQLIGSNFEQTVLQDVKFRYANINAANFTSSTLSAIDNGAGPDFTCAQLGGSDFSSATVNKADFNAAVMPQANAGCCVVSSGGYDCGSAINGDIYGTTEVPSIPSGVNVDCPNGQSGNCTTNHGSWVIKNWKTDTCSSQTQTLWTPPTCGSGPKTLHISDANLKSCLQDILYNGANQPITAKAAANMKYLTCSDRGISDVSVLDKTNFPNLVTLDLSVNQLTHGDFSNFSENLVNVKLSYNQLSELKFSTSKQKVINTLEASNNQITALDISADVYLSYLDLSNNQLTGDFEDTYTFEGVTNISYIDLSGNQLTQVYDKFNTTNTPALNTLSLHNNNLTNIGSLEALWSAGNLYDVNLGNNCCFQCATLCVSEHRQQQFQCSCDVSTCAAGCSATCPSTTANP